MTPSVSAPAEATFHRPGRGGRAPGSRVTIGPMDLTLSAAELELQARARAYVTDVLQPLEVEFERAAGRLAPEVGRELRRAAIAANLHGGSLPKAVGGQGWTALEQRPRPRTARPGDRRPVVVHPGRLQRARPVHPGPAPALSRPVASAASAPAPTRSPRTGRLGCPDPRGDRRPRRRDRRLRPQRREVVRDRPGRHRLHDLPLQSHRRAASPADAVPRRLRPAGRPAQARSRLHAHVRRPASAVRPRGRPGGRRRRSSARSGPPTS